MTTLRLGEDVLDEILFQSRIGDLYALKEAIRGIVSADEQGDTNDINARNESGREPGKTDSLTAILVQVHHEDAGCNTPLHYAAANGHLGESFGAWQAKCSTLADGAFHPSSL